MKKTIVGMTPVFVNAQGAFEVDSRLQPNEIEAKRCIHPLEGREFAGIATVTFEYDRDAAPVSGMVYAADEKIARRIPCLKEDGSYMTDADIDAAEAARDAAQESAE